MCDLVVRRLETLWQIVVNGIFYGLFMIIGMIKLEDTTTIGYYLQVLLINLMKNIRAGFDWKSSSL